MMTAQDALAAHALFLYIEKSKKSAINTPNAAGYDELARPDHDRRPFMYSHSYVFTQ
ncbi:hypothetical protein [Dickeya dadantii]|uniref:hypothetical protein n=1 Tax=Dickeya dadantii TaxID=204038 RepID=UPI0021D80306|nr:hypothetical protein [Dickeya dadantii]